MKTETEGVQTNLSQKLSATADAVLVGVGGDGDEARTGRAADLLGGVEGHRSESGTVGILTARCESASGDIGRLSRQAAGRGGGVVNSSVVAAGHLRADVGGTRTASVGLASRLREEVVSIHGDHGKAQQQSKSKEGLHLYRY